MFRHGRLLALGLLLFSPGYARQDSTICGTTRDRAKEQVFLHRQSVARRARFRKLAQTAVGAGRDYGDIFVLDGGDGVIASRNDFDLDTKTVTFTPGNASASSYRVTTAAYDPANAPAATRIDGLGDDDTRSMVLPFPFPFFGATYTQVYVNSDGNLTFTQGDNASSDRSYGRMVAGPPRISGLFRDLDPSKSASGVRVASSADGFVVTWVAVPEYSDTGNAPLQTFQIRLSPNGKIEISYSGVTTTSALAGIAPGRLRGTSSLVDLSQVSGTQDYTAAVAERFAGTSELDTVAASIRFFETHDDAYDYLVLFNNLDIPAGPGAIAVTNPVRQRFKGIGDGPRDEGRDWGSASRLQAVIDMGPLSQYPADVNNGLVRIFARDTPVTILAHESGHLFLAYASVRDGNGGEPMLGYQQAHWAFTFNSDASVLEGNRLQDNGTGLSPRFVTVGVTEHYSALDQYLMGLRAPEEVGPTFAVLNSTVDPNGHQRLGVSFDGTRQDVRVEDVIAAQGRRIPDQTVSQRRYRWAFAYIVPQGTQPAQADLDKLNNLRTSFETYFARATDGRASAETSLKRALQISTYPAAGVLQGSAMTASVSVAAPVGSPLTVNLSAPQGFIAAPQQVTIPAGASSVRFQVSGVRTGVEELVAQAADPQYATAYSHVQVSPSLSSLRLVTVSGDRQPILQGAPIEPVVLKAVDANELPYPGIKVDVSVTAGGTVAPQSAVTGEDGTISVQWTPSAGTPANELTASLCSCAPTLRAVALGKPWMPAEGIVNAATFKAGLAPGGLASIFGANLSALQPAAASSADWGTKLGDVSITVAGQPARIAYASDNQINFLVPAGVAAGSAEIVVSNSLGATAPVSATLQTLAPGIFFDSATGTGAVLVAGTGQLTTQRPAGAGDFLEVYCTGLGSVHASALGPYQETDAAVQASIGSAPADVVFSGLQPSFLGLYQVNVRVPNGVPSGLQPLSITAGGQRSNEVRVQIR